MSSCELCGRDVDSLKKAKIEGATLNVCDSCADMGEEVQTSSSKKTRKKKKSRSSGKTKRETDTLASDYGKRVRSAREEEKLSIAEVAEDLNEKESVIQKVENQELKPERSLASKLSKKFGVDLYVNPEVADVDTDSGDTRSATLGDVAEVKD
jgi:putative transcription factor